MNPGDPAQQTPLPPMTPGQRQAAEVMLGVAVGFFAWMLLGAPGA